MEKKDEWLRVILLKEPNEPEEIPVSLVEDMGEHCIGILEMEPSQDFGYHKGDKIGFIPFTPESGETILISDMNPSRQLTEEALEDGVLLKHAIEVFNNERNETNLFVVMELLRDSNIWVPCTAEVIEADELRENFNGDFEKLAGMEFVAHEETRNTPIILQKGDAFFFPVFTSEEELGEFGDSCSIIKKHFLEALQLAKNNDKEMAGVVVNAFSESFVLGREIWDIVENMKSSLS